MFEPETLQGQHRARAHFLLFKTFDSSQDSWFGGDLLSVKEDRISTIRLHEESRGLRASCWESQEMNLVEELWGQGPKS